MQCLTLDFDFDFLPTINIPGLSDKLSHPSILFFSLISSCVQAPHTSGQPLHAMGMHQHQRRCNDDAGSSSAAVARLAVAATSVQPWHDGQQRNGNTRGGSMPQQDMHRLDTQRLDTIIICKSPFFFLSFHFSFSLLGSVCSKAVARWAANAMAVR